MFYDGMDRDWTCLLCGRGTVTPTVEAKQPPKFRSTFTGQCADCGVTIWASSTRCVACYQRDRYGAA